jgi:hypothetical protein
MSFVKTAVILLICFTSGAANAAESVGFEERILPLFYQRCFSCHSEKEEKPKGGLKLDSVTSIRESGVIVKNRLDTPAATAAIVSIMRFWVNTAAAKRVKAGINDNGSAHGPCELSVSFVSIHDFSA